MISALRNAALLFATALPLACATSTHSPEPEAPGDLVASDKARVSAQAPKADLDSAVRGQTTLALDLYRELTEGSVDNLFVSPLSISLALSMSRAGAEGTTDSAFASLLGSGLDEAAHHRAMNDLEAQLSSRGQGATGADGQPFRLVMANQAFGQSGYPIETPFLDTLAMEYGAGLRLLDFGSAAEPSRVTINDWVATKTEDRIKDLLAPGIITGNTRLVLVNAIYFNASWKTPFEATKTVEGDFQALDGSTKRADFMHHDELTVRAAQVDGVEVVELPYDGEELSMLLLMPPAGTFETFEDNLTTQVFEGYVGALQSSMLRLDLPKFEVRTAAKLKTPLSSLGLAEAFTPAADFSAITAADRLFIADVVHQAFVKVNEAGTEAAASTAVIFTRDSVPLVRDVKLDRPFVFAIRDNATGALVFLGRVTNP